jgi:hypothetical protein
VFFVKEHTFWADDAPKLVGTMKGNDPWNVYIKGKAGKEIPVPMVHVSEEVKKWGTTDDWATWADEQDDKWGYSAQTDMSRNLGARAVLSGDRSFNTEKYLGVKRFKAFAATLAIAAGTAAISAVASWRAAGMIEGAEGVNLAANAGARPGAIMPYTAATRYTTTMAGRIQAHHILEARHLKNWRYSAEAIEGAPSIILSRAEHELINKQLGKLLPTGVNYTKEAVWKAYQTAYQQHPEWLEAIKSYFDK